MENHPAMPLTLTLREPSARGLDADLIAPDRLLTMGPAEISRLSVRAGNRREPLGDFFQVQHERGEDGLVVRGDLKRVHGLGQGMTSGRLHIIGDVGDRLGAGMSGGSIELEGNCGHLAGAAMQGGQLRISGSAGDFLGAAEPGHVLGMRGGVILVGGGVGHDAGLAMRRGLVAVAGATGDRLGRGLVAGTILVFGEAGKSPGLGMKRGTIALLQPQSVEISGTFRYACRLRPTFLALYLKQLSAWSFPTPAAASEVFERYNGDVLELGKGELLVACN